MDLGPAVSNDEDPIAASLRARVDAGGLSTQIREADCKKQKIFVPGALNLKVKNAALVSWDMPA